MSGSRLLLALTRLLHRLFGLDGGRRSLWHTHGATIVDDLLVDAVALVGLLLACVLWRRLRRPLPAGHALGLSWVLITGVACTVALGFALLTLPERIHDSERLLPSVSRLSGIPIYTDGYTANDLNFLLGYHPARLDTTGLNIFYGPRLEVILHMRRACVLLDEPVLDSEAAGGRTISPEAYSLLAQAPRGWRIVVRLGSVANPLERLDVLCTRSVHFLLSIDGPRGHSGTHFSRGRSTFLAERATAGL